MDGCDWMRLHSALSLVSQQQTSRAVCLHSWILLCTLPTYTLTLFLDSNSAMDAVKCTQIPPLPLWQASNSQHGTQQTAEQFIMQSLVEEMYGVVLGRITMSTNEIAEYVTYFPLTTSPDDCTIHVPQSVG